ncbi:MAG: hypothetical protein IPK17_35400 [Chloroflexi bacterium]|uniref:pPIWI_RE_Z domain-containing protein n=1 Tax=Candidatus Flexifilum breve TaxID=3140694 RepID=UPI0031354D66|nr:hypothetical protein [Chloroflexota bacterium]
MRNIGEWHSELSRILKKSWNEETPSFSARRLCEIELGLTACEVLAPAQPVDALWVLLTGYTLQAVRQLNWKPEQRYALAVARHLLPYFRGPYAWDEAMRWYQQLPKYIRGYDLSNGALQRHDTSVAPWRFDLYHATLQKSPPLQKRPVRWAKAGNYAFRNGQRYQDVTIPSHWVKPLPQGHNLTPKPKRKSLKVKWEQLLETAGQMDKLMPGNDFWKRLDRIKLTLWEHGEMRVSPTLGIDGLLHLAGMVSSGKSTLMQVLTVWAAQNGLHVTVVLGDVVNVLEWNALFVAIGLNAVPVIGGYNRTLHLNRLHRVESQQNPDVPLKPQHASFQWLGTVCAVNGTSTRPTLLDPRQFPCNRLEKTAQLDDDTPEYYACPIYNICGVHKTQRDLPEAQIWVATPASLLYTRVAAQINEESLRFGELVSRRSDLILVDEADRVQTQLDTVFSPSEILAGTGVDPWLNQLSSAVEEQIRRRGRETLITRDVEAWMSVQRSTQMAADKLYVLLLQRKTELARLQQDYFTGWTVWEALVSEILGIADWSVSQKNTDETYTKLMGVFNRFVRNPVDSRSDDDAFTERLRDIVRALLTEPSLSETDRQLQTELREVFPQAVADDKKWSRWATHFAFALVVSVVSWGSTISLKNWEQVKIPLELKDNNTALFYNPPQDYDAVIPPAPMGNVLAFQYFTGTESEKAGILRFFRISGVGRWWLLNLHRLFEAEGISGPNVLLLSGTSWAGTSPLYHIQYPIGGILHAPQQELDAIQKNSRFRYTPVVDEKLNRPISVSGTSYANRHDALQKILVHYTQPTGPSRTEPSRFEQERDSLPVGRQRLILLVGSYGEAEAVRIMLEQMRPDWRGKVFNLVRDDDSPIDSWMGSEATLQRGQVNRFAETDGWILTAPLLAIERGHNILNENKQAAIGAAYFLVRPIHVPMT